MDSEGSGAPSESLELPPPPEGVFVELAEEGLEALPLGGGQLAVEERVAFGGDGGGDADGEDERRRDALEEGQEVVDVLRVEGGEDDEAAGVVRKPAWP